MDYIVSAKKHFNTDMGFSWFLFFSMFTELMNNPCIDYCLPPPCKAKLKFGSALASSIGSVFENKNLCKDNS